MILIALMRARTPPSTDNSKRVIKYQTFQTPFYSSFESVENIVFSFDTNYEQSPFKVINDKDKINAFRVSLINSHLHVVL